MTGNEAIDYIHSAHKFGIKLSLGNIKYLLDLMENPHNKLKYVHVAGTNGKGSTVAYISSILNKAEYKVGIYTSPYIERFTERIRISDEEISMDDLGMITNLVKDKVEFMVSQGKNHPTEFELCTSIAFQYFYEKKCDIVVLEVGLGGQYDATNVIEKSEVSVITTISYDHMGILGSTIEEIATAKAGIIKDKNDVLLYPQVKEAERVFEDIAKIKNANLIKFDFECLKLLKYSEKGQIFDYEDFKGIEINLIGDHQLKNAVTAINVAKILKSKGYNKITKQTIYFGLKETRWAGRLEVLHTDPLLIIDGAHNAEGVEALVNTMNKYFPDKKKIFIFGVLRDKDVDTIAKISASIADQFLLITPSNERALPNSELSKIVKVYNSNVLLCNTINEGVEIGLKNASENGMVCAFGSLYYIGEIRKMFELQRRRIL